MNTKPSIAASLLLLALALATVLRVWGMDYGLPHPTARPDEERIVGRAVQVLATGDFHPGDYTYPGLTKYLNALALYLWVQFGTWVGRYEKTFDFLFEIAVYQPGLQYRICRAVSVLFGVLTVGATYFLGRRAHRSHAVGLLAALLVATAMLHVRDSRFATVDVTMTFFITVTLLFSVIASSSGQTRHFALAGVSAGLAAAAKYNAGLVIVTVYAAALWGERGSLKSTAYKTALATGAMVLVFSVTTPYTLLHAGAVIEELREIRHILYGGTGPRALWTHLAITFPSGFGWTFFLAGIAGLARAVWLRRPTDWVLLSFFVPSLATALMVRWIFPRYLIPYVPILAVWAAECVVSTMGRSRAPRIAMAGVVLIVPSLWQSIQLDRVAAQADTRVQASDWVAANLPPRTEILLCQGYGAPKLNSDRRRPPAFVSREIDCSPTEVETSSARYVITHEHPQLHPYSGVTERMRSFLHAEGRPRAVFDPFVREASRGAEAYFYVGDAFYLPFTGFDAVERGGPIVTVWELGRVSP